MKLTLELTDREAATLAHILRNHVHNRQMADDAVTLGPLASRLGKSRRTDEKFVNRLLRALGR